MESSRVGLDLFKNLFTPDVRSAHLLAFSAAFGAHAWVTFAQGPILLTNLPRQQAGNLLSKLFPVYFSWNALFSAVLVGTLAWDHPVVRKHPFDIGDVTVYQAFTLASTTVANLINALVVGPANYKLVNERHRQEKEEGKSYDAEGVSDKMKKLNTEFAALHTASTALNFVSFGGLLFHGLWLAKRGLPWSSLNRVLE